MIIVYRKISLPLLLRFNSKTVKKRQIIFFYDSLLGQ